MRAALLAGVAFPLSARAQSISIDEEHKKPREMPVAPPPSATVAKAPPAPVRPPSPLETPVEYPEGAQGEAEVVLILTVAVDGSVTNAEIASGAPPFAARAIESAKKWKF
ncbi:MAG TPA: hypothetical protein VFQ35_01775, partial [Polyangiaceae bacterium]|nr:hypothetical protein [Polyangiaceae bacterium]